MLGTGLPPVNVLTLEMKPKATAAEPDTMIVATHGRGVYRYVFEDPSPDQNGGNACAATSAFHSLKVKRSGGGLRVAFTRTGRAHVAVDVFQHSAGERIVGERLIARFRKTRSFTWNGRANRRGRRVSDGVYSIRVRSRNASGRVETRRFTFERRRGRFVARRAFYRRQSCGTLASFKLERPVFGGRTNRALNLSGTYSAVIYVTRGDERVVARLYARRL